MSGAASNAVQQPALPEDALVLVPVRNLVLFPGLIVPVVIGRERSIAAAQYAVRQERPVGILLQTAPEVDAPGPDELARVGTVATILRYVSTQDGTHHLICQGQQRFRVLDFLEGYPFTVARIERIEQVEPQGDGDIEARFLKLKERALEMLQFLPQASQEILNAVQVIESASVLGDLVAGYLDIKPQEKQELLEQTDVRLRLDRLLELMAHRIQVLQVSREIDMRTKTSLGQREREFHLREQMKAIQKELGEEAEGNAVEVEELRRQVDASGMTEEARKQADKEIQRLQRMSSGSAEYSIVRTYLDWLVELPWKSPDPDRIDVAQAREMLDADHCGLEQVKKRILEFLAVRKLKPAGHGPILCLVGPPGVGKTSLGQSIAKALGRRSRTTCRRSCSSRPPMCWTRSQGPCATGWKCSSCPATRRRKSALSRASIWWRARWGNAVCNRIS